MLGLGTKDRGLREPRDGQCHHDPRCPAHFSLRGHPGERSQALFEASGSPWVLSEEKEQTLTDLHIGLPFAFHPGSDLDLLHPAPSQLGKAHTAHPLRIRAITHWPAELGARD